MGKEKEDKKDKKDKEDKKDKKDKDDKKDKKDKKDKDDKKDKKDKDDKKDKKDKKGGAATTTAAATTTTTTASTASHRTRDATADSGAPRPLTSYDDATKRAYLILIAAAATSDGKVSDAETELIGSMVSNVGLSNESQTAVATVMEGNGGTLISAALDTIAASGPLRYSLIGDLHALFAVDSVSAEEREFLGALANRLGVSPQELAEIEQAIAAHYGGGSSSGSGSGSGGAPPAAQSAPFEGGSAGVPQGGPEGQVGAVIAALSTQLLGPQAGSVVQGVLQTAPAHAALGKISGLMAQFGLA